MESKERVLEAVGQSWRALQDADEAWRSDREVVLTAVRRDCPVRQNGWALQHARSFRGDPEVVEAAVQQDANALAAATDELLEDPTFAAGAKRRFFLLKLTMLSGPQHTGGSRGLSESSESPRRVPPEARLGCRRRQDGALARLGEGAR
eukprot:1717828-Amphidinium_carterae.1